MSEKRAKKIRQIYRKEVKKNAQEMAQIIGNAMKPKPRWIPWKVWLFFVGFFIKINKTGVKK